MNTTWPEAAIVATVALVLCGALSLMGCAAGSEGGGGVTAADLEGTWLATWEELFQYGGDGENADAMISEISGSSMEVVFYLHTEQVHGVREQSRSTATPWSTP